MKKNVLLVLPILCVCLVMYARASVKESTHNVENDRMPGSALNPPSSVWGGETNQLRAGLIVESAAPELVFKNGQVPFPACLAISNLSTVDVIYYVPRKLSERLTLEMKDANGAHVSKSEYGMQFKRKPLSKGWPAWQWKSAGVQKALLMREEATYISWRVHTDPKRDFVFSRDIPKCFELKKTGDYILTLSLEVYMEGADGTLRPITMPSVTVKVRVE